MHEWPDELAVVVYACRERSTHLIDSEAAAVCACLGAQACSVADLVNKLEGEPGDLLRNAAYMDGLVTVLLALQDARLLVLRPC